MLKYQQDDLLTEQIQQLMTWFAVLGPGEFLFMPIADIKNIDLLPGAGNPVVEYILMEKAAG